MVAGVAFLAGSLLGGCSLVFPFEPATAPGGGDDAGVLRDDALSDAGEPDGGSCGEILSSFVTRGPALSAAVVGEVVVTTWQASGDDSGGADMLDVTDPRHPVLLQRVALRRPNAGLAVSTCPRCMMDDEGRSAARAFVSGGSGIEVLVTEPHLAVVGRLLVSGGALDVAASDNGFATVAALAQGGFALTSVGDVGDDSSGARALSDEGVGLVLDCAMRSVVLLDSARGAALFAESGSCPPGLALFDLTKPEPLHVVPVDAEVSQVAVADGQHLVLAGGATGLWRVTLRGQEPPTLDLVTLPRPARVVAADGPMAFAAGGGALTVVDLSVQKSAPVLAEIELPGEPSAVTLWDGKALVAAGEAGLVLVDVGCLLPEIELWDGRPEAE